MTLSGGKQALKIRAFFKADGMIEGVTRPFEFGQPAPRLPRGPVNGFEKIIGIHAAGAGGLHERAAFPQDAQAKTGQFAIGGQCG
jgi:hypothetical protein